MYSNPWEMKVPNVKLHPNLRIFASVNTQASETLSKTQSSIELQYEPLSCDTIHVPEVFAVVKVPRRGMANHLPSITWFLKHGFVPKLRRHFDQTQRGEELLSHPEHVSGIITLWYRSGIIYSIIQ